MDGSFVSHWLRPAVLAPATALGAPLDGRRSEGAFSDRGTTSGGADTLNFRVGRFRSTAYDHYVCSDAPHKATTISEMVFFEAETERPRCGKLLWEGEIGGGKFEAPAMSIRQGKAPVENWVVAGANK